jgi:hypothetical protein
MGSCGYDNVIRFPEKAGSLLSKRLFKNDSASSNLLVRYNYEHSFQESIINMQRRIKWNRRKLLAQGCKLAADSEVYWRWCNTRDYWDFGLCLSSIVLKDTTFCKQDLIRPKMRGWETPSPLRKFKRVNLNHWRTPFPEDGNISSFRTVVPWRIPDDGKSS